MGWSPDVFGLYDTLTCQEYLEVMAAAYRLPAGVRAARAEQLLGAGPAAVRRTRRCTRCPAGRSSGSGWPGRWCTTRPCCCSTSRPPGSTRAAGWSCATCCAGWPSEGRAVLVSSHILSDLEEVADRVVFVDRRPYGRPARGRRAARGPVGPDLPAAGARPGRAAAGAGAGRASAGSAAGHAGIDVQVLGGEAAAARLLGELVAAGVAVTAFAPVGGSLEAAYLDLVEGQK